MASPGGGECWISLGSGGGGWMKTHDIIFRGHIMWSNSHEAQREFLYVFWNYVPMGRKHTWNIMDSSIVLY